MSEQRAPAVPALRPDTPGPGGGRPRLVVGVDGSPGSRAALRYALVAAVARDADLEVESAVPLQLYWMGNYPVSPSLFATLRSGTEAGVEALLEEVRGEVTPDLPRDRVRVFATGGGAAQTLLERAEGADLLIVGSRGRGAVRSALLGSVALRCLAAAPCPVVVVHEDAPTEGPGAGAVVVGVDGSAASAAALAVAAEEAVQAGVRLDVVSAHRPIDYWSDDYDVLLATSDQIEADLTRAIEEMVSATMASLPRAPAEVRTVVLEGFPADVLLERARGAQLLVIGSSGHGALGGLLVGSVALQCVVHGSGAVEVVPAHRRDPVADAAVDAAVEGVAAAGP